MSRAAEAAPSSYWPVTICVMLATIMQAIDTTIANVALPYMQGSLSATLDQANWVLTSYIVAAAIMTPPTGWLAGRFGRKRLFLVQVAGLHRGLGPVRPRPDPGPDGPVPAAAGPLRRRARAAVAGGPARHLAAREARLGHGAVGRRRHGRPDPGPDPRRLAHRELQLALGVLRQRAGGHPHHHGPGRPSCARATGATSRSTGSASPRSASPSARCSSCSTAASS